MFPTMFLVSVKIQNSRNMIGNSRVRDSEHKMFPTMFLKLRFNAFRMGGPAKNKHARIALTLELCAPRDSQLCSW